MIYLRAKLVRILLEFFESNDRRIDHALRVLHHSDCLMDNYPGCDEEVVVAVALLHDIGSKISMEKHGVSTHENQEIHGPDAAEELLLPLGYPPEKIDRIKNIIANHHSPSRYDYPELALLKTADHIVNSSTPPETA